MKGKFFNYQNALEKPLEVKKLYLSGYKEEDLNLLYRFENLEFLELKGFKILNLPDNLSNLQNLKKLHLIDNFFLEIPQTVFELDLDSLKIENGDIQEIPSQIADLHNLSELNINNLSHIQRIPEEISNLEKLKYLYLKNNKLKTLPEQIGKLQQLTHLDISNNLLKTLPQSFARLNLKKFWANATPFYAQLGNKREKLLDLLKQFQHRGESDVKRELAFQMFLENYSNLEKYWNREEILELLNFYNKVIRQNTLLYLHQKNQSPFTSTKPLQIRIIGKNQNLDLEQHISSLEEKEIFVEKRWNKKVNMIFVGEYPKQQLAKALATNIDIFPITYLKDFLNTLEKPYLANDNPETLQMAESLADLLRSEEESNQELGLEMALGGGINDMYFYDLLLLYIWNDNRKIKNMTENILEKYLPSQTFLHLKNNCKSYYDNPSEDMITQYLESLSNQYIDPSKLGYTFYQATARGKKYCLRYQESFKKVIKNEVKNSVLHLNNLGLLKLNTEIVHFDFLKMLYLNKNKLSTLPENFTSLRKLKLLVLASNRFKRIPNTIFSLNKLRNLDFSKNELENISEEIEKLSSLVNLNLSSNKIKDLPLSIGRLQNLRSLNIKKNPIVKNKDFIKKLSDLLPNCTIYF